MSADRKLNRLNGATRECLERCYQSDNWLDCLASYVEGLRADGWARWEIQQVEATVRRILGAIAESEAAQAMTPQATPPAPDVASASP